MNAKIVAETTVIMPVGGKAMRAQAMTQDRIPKHLIEVGGKAVLTIMCQALQRVGFRRFVFCVGHHHEQILAHVHQDTWRIDAETTYDISTESIPLGPDGAVLQAMDRLDLKGNALLIPGDTILPWASVATMALQHVERCNEFTIGVTSAVTLQNSQSDTYISEVNTDRLLAYYPKCHPFPPATENQAACKSAAATVVQVQAFTHRCRTFVEDQPEGTLLNFRHCVLPWLLLNGVSVSSYDLAGESIDLGTVENIHHAQVNWKDYIS